MHSCFNFLLHLLLFLVSSLSPSLPSSSSFFPFYITSNLFILHQYMFLYHLVYLHKVNNSCFSTPLVLKCLLLFQDLLLSCFPQPPFYFTPWLPPFLLLLHNTSHSSCSPQPLISSQPATLLPLTPGLPVTNREHPPT